jgi:hypothetical protein
MIFRFYIPLFFYILLQSATAQTIVPAGSEVSGRWVRDSSPYLVMGMVTVPDKDILRIEKGVEIQFQTWNGSTRHEETQAGWLRVQGQLIAEGTEKDRIVFTRTGTDGSWGIIFFDSLSSQNRLEHCVVQYAGIIDGIRNEYQTYAGISVFKSDVSIKNCIITANMSYGVVSCIGSNTMIYNSLVAGNFGAGIGCFDVGPHIEKTTITDHSGAGVYAQREAEPHLKRCVLTGNLTPIHAETAILEKCIFDDRPHGRQVTQTDCDLVQPAPSYLSWVIGNEVLAPISEWAGRGIGCSWLRDQDSRSRLAVFLKGN